MGWARMELETEITDYKPTSCCKPVAPPLIIRQARKKLEADLKAQEARGGGKPSGLNQASDPILIRQYNTGVKRARPGGRVRYRYSARNR